MMSDTSTGPEPALRLDGVSRRYGRKVVLDSVTHTFGQGLTLLTGPSGAGKSTLLRLCATAEKPSAGTIAWQGLPLNAGGRKALRRVLGYAPQAVDLPDQLTAREFGLHIAALKGLRQGEADDQFRLLLDQVGLGDDANGRISTFSGGMRRRLIFAQALLGSPRLLILDEPTAELDSESRARIGALITAAAESAVVIMTTHLSEGVAENAAAVLRVEGGKLAPASA